VATVKTVAQSYSVGRSRNYSYCEEDCWCLFLSNDLVILVRPSVRKRVSPSGADRVTRLANLTDHEEQDM